MHYQIFSKLICSCDNFPLDSACEEILNQSDVLEESDVNELETKQIHSKTEEVLQCEACYRQVNSVYFISRLVYNLIFHTYTRFVH